jgi:hypothetical protein
VDEALGELAAEEGEEEVITSVLQDEQRKAVAEEFQKKLEAERAKFEEEMNQAVEAQRRLKEVNFFTSAYKSTCFTGTKAQMLTPQGLRVRSCLRSRRRSVCGWRYTQFTCFTTGEKQKCKY